MVLLRAKVKPARQQQVLHATRQKPLLYRRWQAPSQVSRHCFFLARLERATRATPPPKSPLTISLTSTISKPEKERYRSATSKSILFAFSRREPWSHTITPTDPGSAPSFPSPLSATPATAAVARRRGRWLLRGCCRPAADDVRVLPGMELGMKAAATPAATAANQSKRIAYESGRPQWYGKECGRSTLSLTGAVESGTGGARTLDCQGGCTAFL